MKKLILSICLLTAVALTGCFDTTEETTINDDGSGKLVTTLDMGAVIKMAKMFGGDKTEDIDKIVIDSTINMADFKDSLTNLTDAEKKMLDKATMRTVMNPKQEEMKMIYSFPYSSITELATINTIKKKVMAKTQGSVMEKILKAGGDEGKGMMGTEGQAMMEDGEMGLPNLDEYFTFSIANGKISKKLNKEKYAGAKDNKGLTSMQEIGQMGAPMTMKTVYNLPKPAKKTTGKGISLSSDKKKITIEGSLDDFFDKPELFEYEIEY